MCYLFRVYISQAGLQTLMVIELLYIRVCRAYLWLHAMRDDQHQALPALICPL